MWPLESSSRSVSTFSFCFSNCFEAGVVHGMDESMTWHNVRHAIDEFNVANVGLPVPLSLGLVHPTDPFASVEDRFCDVVQRELIGLFVPTDVLNAEQLMLVFSMCNRFHIPCLTTDDNILRFNGMDFFCCVFLFEYLGDNFYVQNVAPPSGLTGKALAQLISSLGWNSFLLVYEKAEDLVDVTALLSIYYNEHGTRTQVRVLQLPPTFDHYDAFLKHVRERLKQTNMVVHTKNIGLIHELLLRANRMSMCDFKYSYLFTHPDLSLLDEVLGFDRFNYRCNISGIRLSQKAPLLKTELALATSAVDLFGETLKSLARRPLLPQPAAVLCDAGDVWVDGELFNSALRKMILPGAMRLAPVHGQTLARANVTLEGVTRTKGHFTERV
ncbi:Glutamate receptor ionotropic, kainate 2 [Aphelenchoides fujianensis]|nr:Glutamate receptor ionotropic, kainate 2 [Aphelenchoides fujianensis]